MWRTSLLVMISIAALVCSAAIATSYSLLDKYSLDAESMMQWRLPDRLNEISGLALTPSGRLLAVDDEVAIVYELDYDDGGIVKKFALGKPVVKGDFEGIAVVDDLVYLTTSSGRVYVAAEGADGQRVTFDNFDTELGEYCEIEGLVQSTDNTRLYFLCKKVRKKYRANGLRIFAWDIAARKMLPEESITLPERDIVQRMSVDRFSPTGVTIDEHSGNRIIIASRQRILVEVSASGELVNARHIPLETRHRQAEGIELANDGRLLIADEGGTHRGRLAVYQQDRIGDNEND